MSVEVGMMDGCVAGDQTTVNVCFFITITTIFPDLNHAAVIMHKYSGE